MKLISESTDDLIYESVIDESNKKSWKISGITLQADVMNKNRRTYPKAILSEAINKHTNEFMKDGRCCGELNHPDKNISSIDYERVSHKFTKVEESGSNYITHADVLDTPTGKIVQSLLEAGIKLGISSRALGNIKSSSAGNIVESLHLISLGDIVSDPSGINCYTDGIYESIDYQLNEKGIIEEIQIETINETLNTYNKIIKQSSKEEINKAISSIIGDFLSKINK